MGCLSLKPSSNNAPNCLDAAVGVLAVLLGAAVPRAAAPPVPVRSVHPGRGPGHSLPSPDSGLDHLTHRWAGALWTLNQSFIV